MAIIYLLDYPVPLEWVISIGGVFVLLVFLLVRATFAKKPQTEPETLAYEYEASGMTWPIAVKEESPTHIEYEISYGKGSSPQQRTVKHTHPLTLHAFNQRIFLVPRGSTKAFDPESSFREGQDFDDPEPVMQEVAFWYRAVRLAQAAALALKNPTVLLFVFLAGAAMFMFGMIAQANWKIIA